MDIFGTTVTVLKEIYNITVFIKGIVDDVKSYDSDTDDIRRKLKHEFVFVDTCKSMFFEDPTSSVVYKKHSLMLQEDVQSILHSLKRVLAEYGIEARKHGILDTASDDKGTAGKVADGSQTEVHQRPVTRRGLETSMCSAVALKFWERILRRPTQMPKT